MAGTITHEWNGTILTITSDSGTSSCDLKGDQGDMGIRGAQGEPGVSILNDVVVPTDEHINSLIDAKLGVIENGSY